MKSCSSWVYSSEVSQWRSFYEISYVTLALGGTALSVRFKHR